MCIRDSTNRGQEEANKPGKAEFAVNAIKEIFGDLINKKQLGRLAVEYLGSLALGYSPQASMRYAGRNYLSRIDALASTRDKLVLGGEYTKDSIDTYIESGDVADLVGVEQQITYTPQKEVKLWGEPGTNKTVQAQLHEGSDGSEVWINTKTNKPIPKGYTDDQYQLQGTKEFDDRIRINGKEYEEQIKAILDKHDTFEDKSGKKT